MRAYGDYIRNERVKAELSLRYIADSLSISHVHLGELERGERRIFPRKYWDQMIALIPSITRKELQRLSAYAIPYIGLMESFSMVGATTEIGLRGEPPKVGEITDLVFYETNEAFAIAKFIEVRDDGIETVAHITDHFSHTIIEVVEVNPTIRCPLCHGEKQLKLDSDNLTLCENCGGTGHVQTRRPYRSMRTKELCVKRNAWLNAP